MRPLPHRVLRPGRSRGLELRISYIQYDIYSGTYMGSSGRRWDPRGVHCRAIDFKREILMMVKCDGSNWTKIYMQEKQIRTGGKIFSRVRASRREINIGTELRSSACRARPYGVLGAFPNISCKCQHRSRTYCGPRALSRG